MERPKRCKPQTPQNMALQPLATQGGREIGRSLPERKASWDHHTTSAPGRGGGLPRCSVGGGKRAYHLLEGQLARVDLLDRSRLEGVDGLAEHRSILQPLSESALLGLTGQRLEPGDGDRAQGRIASTSQHEINIAQNRRVSGGEKLRSKSSPSKEYHCVACCSSPTSYLPASRPATSADILPP